MCRWIEPVPPWTGAGKSWKPTWYSRWIRRGCGLARRLRAVQKRLDVAGEHLEIIELLLQHLFHHGEVDLQVAMDEDIAETRDRPEARSEFRGNSSQLGKSVDRARVIG